MSRCLLPTVQLENKRKLNDNLDFACVKMTTGCVDLDPSWLGNGFLKCKDFVGLRHLCLQISGASSVCCSCGGG